MTENDITGALDLSFTVSEEIFGQVRIQTSKPIRAHNTERQIVTKLSQSPARSTCLSCHCVRTIREIDDITNTVANDALQSLPFTIS